MTSTSPQPDKTKFQQAYEQLSEQGWCDSYGGQESVRVEREWTEAGCPTDVYTFIKKHANRGPV